MADRIRRENPPPIRCGARARSTGRPCQRWAIPGATRCKLHGGLAGRNGRARAVELHATRRIEALVTDFASRAMIEAGFPVEVVQMAGGSLPAPDPDEESKPSVTDDDVEAALQTSLARLAGNLAVKFQGMAVELAQRQAQAAASRPATIDGEVTASKPAPTAQEPAPDPEPAPTPEPEPDPEPAPTPEPEPDPEPAQELTVKRQPAPQRGPRRDAKGRIVTTLGLRPDNRVGSYRTFT